jgi:hypothetical protein
MEYFPTGTNKRFPQKRPGGIPERLSEWVVSVQVVLGQGKAFAILLWRLGQRPSRVAWPDDRGGYEQRRLQLF